MTEREDKDRGRSHDGWRESFDGSVALVSSVRVSERQSGSVREQRERVMLCQLRQSRQAVGSVVSKERDETV